MIIASYFLHLSSIFLSSFYYLQLPTPRFLLSATDYWSLLGVGFPSCFLDSTTFTIPIPLKATSRRTFDVHSATPQLPQHRTSAATTTQAPPSNNSEKLSRCTAITQPVSNHTGHRPPFNMVRPPFSTPFNAPKARRTALCLR